LYIKLYLMQFYVHVFVIQQNLARIITGTDLSKFAKRTILQQFESASLLFHPRNLKIGFDLFIIYDWVYV